jgi:hypothetical protein
MSIMIGRPRVLPHLGTAELAIVLFGLLRAALELPFPLSGGDALRKWMWARLIYHGWSPSRAIWGGWDHHASRVAINVPALFSQYLLGDAPWVYYVAPLCLSSLALVFLFRLALRLGSVTFAFVCCLSYAWFLPIRHATQLMPDGLSTTYVLGATLCLVKLVEAEGLRRRAAWALAGGVCMMLAELTKEPNLFFVPGLMLGLWWVTRRPWLPLLFGASVSALMLVELAVYRLAFDEYPLGRFSVIAEKHLSNGLVSQGLANAWELVTRQKDTFQGFWGIQLALFLGAAVFCLLRFRRVPPALQIVLLAGLGFLLLHAFGVRSLHPLRPWQRALPRYVVVSYPLTWLTLCWCLAQVSRALARRFPLGSERLNLSRFGSERLGVAFGGAAMVALLAYAFATRFPGVAAHPLSELAQMDRESQAASAEGIPVVSRQKKKYAVQSFQALFWEGFDQPEYAKRKRLPALSSISFRGGPLWWLVDPARERIHPRKAKGVFQKWRKEKREVLVVTHENTLLMKRQGFQEL